MSRPTIPLEPSKLQTLLNDIIHRVGIDFPEWVENRENDPGVTVLQLFAFLEGALFYREGEMPEPTRRRLWELGCSLQRLAGSVQAVAVDGELWKLVSDLSQAGSEESVYTLETDNAATIRFGDGVHGRRPARGSKVTATYRGIGGFEEISVIADWPFGNCAEATVRLAVGTIRFQPLAPPEPSSIKRVRYFYGQMLSVGDFQTEQSYFLEKQKRHNRYLHGFGVVDGLEVKDGGNKVVVSPGMALDPAGNEIIVPAPVELALGTRSGDGYVSLKYSERDSDPLPFAGGDQYTRIEEGFELSFEGSLADCGLAIARLVWTGEECQLDPEFKPCRVNPCS